MWAHLCYNNSNKLELQSLLNIMAYLNPLPKENHCDHFNTPFFKPFFKPFANIVYFP